MKQRELGMATPANRSVRLDCVLYYLQVMFLCDRRQSIYIDALSVQVDRNDRPGA